MTDNSITTKPNFHSLKKQSQTTSIDHIVVVSEKKDQIRVHSDFIVDWQISLPHIKIRNN